MIVYVNEEGETFASFFDTFTKAESVKSTIENGCGLYCELYKREETKTGYEYKLFII